MGMVDTEYEVEEKINKQHVHGLILLGSITDEQIASALELNVETIQEIREELEEEGKLPKK